MMATHKIKLDYNNLMRQIDETLSAENIESVHKNAFGIAIGLELSCGHLRELAQHAIDTNDEYLMQWCLDMGILKCEEAE